METATKVHEILKSSAQPLKVAEIAEKLGVERPEVDKAIKQLKKEEKIFSPKNCFYCAK